MQGLTLFDPKGRAPQGRTPLHMAISPRLRCSVPCAITAGADFFSLHHISHIGVGVVGDSAARSDPAPQGVRDQWMASARPLCIIHSIRGYNRAAPCVSHGSEVLRRCDPLLLPIVLPPSPRRTCLVHRCCPRGPGCEVCSSVAHDPNCVVLRFVLLPFLLSNLVSGPSSRGPCLRDSRLASSLAARFAQALQACVIAVVSQSFQFGMTAAQAPVISRAVGRLIAHLVSRGTRAAVVEFRV